MNTVRRYFDLTTAERLSLNDANFIRSIELEAAHRGVQLPTKLDDAMNLAGAKGFNIPGDASKVYELCARKTSYGTPERTGIAFLTEEAAKKALEGAVAVSESGYDVNRKLAIQNPYESFEVRIGHIIHTPQKGYWTKLVELTEDTEKFDKLCEECREDLQTIRQAAYDAQVTQQRRARYLELANGDEAVAANFWRNAFGTEFPAAPTN